MTSETQVVWIAPWESANALKALGRQLTRTLANALWGVGKNGMYEV